MADFDVSMRFGVDYQPEGAKRFQRDLAAIRKAAGQLGSERVGQGMAGDLDKAARGAKSAKDALDRLGGAEDRLKKANGTEILRREAQRLGAAYDRAQTQAAELRAAVDRLKTSDGAGVLARELANVERSSDRSKSALDTLRAAAAQLGTVPGAQDLKADIDRLAGSAEKTDGEIEQIREAVRRLGREDGADELRRDFDRAESSARQLEDRIQRVNRASVLLGGGGVAGSRVSGARARGIRDGVEEFTERVGGATLVPALRSPYVAAGIAAAAPIYGAYKATGQAISLESAMADVKRQAPADADIPTLRNGILELSEDLGIAKESLAALVASAAKTGTAFEDLLPFASYAAKFAVAGEMGQDEAGGTLSLLRSQFSVPQSRIPEILDSVNYLADRSATQERLILNFMARSAQNVDLGTFSPEQIAAFGTGFLNVGVRPEVAGTGFNALINRVGTASDRSRSDKDFRRSLSRLGLSGRQLQSDFYEDSTGAILGLFDKVNALPKEQRLPVLRGLGGDEYADDLARIAGQTGKIRGFLDDSVSPAAKGSVEATFAVYNDTTARNLAKAGASLASLGAELGENFLPAVNLFAKAVAQFASYWADDIRESRHIRGPEELTSDIDKKKQELAGLGAPDPSTPFFSLLYPKADELHRQIAWLEMLLKRAKAQQQQGSGAATPGTSGSEETVPTVPSRASPIHFVPGETRARIWKASLGPDETGPLPFANGAGGDERGVERRLDTIDRTLKAGFGDLNGRPGAATLWDEGMGGAGGGGSPRFTGAGGRFGGGPLAGGSGGGSNGSGGGAPFRTTPLGRTEPGSPLAIAERFSGKHERRDRQEIAGFIARNSSAGAIDPATVAWCAAFVNAALGAAGEEGTGSNLARSFMKWGKATEDPKKGDVAVLKRGRSKWAGHVGFVQGFTERDGKRYVQVLGGNQSDGVNVREFPVDDVLGYRRSEADPKAMSEAAEPLTGYQGSFADDGWSADETRRPTKGSGAPRPKPKPARVPEPGRRPQGASTPMQFTNHFHGVDPQIMAARAARAQRREIMMAEARALHDTAVPVG